nr:hypothetical protein [Angustibacter aerolatus]
MRDGALGRRRGGGRHRAGPGSRCRPPSLDAAVDDLVAALLAPDPDAVREVTALLDGAGHRSERDQAAAERAAQGRRLRSLLAQRATGGKRAPGGGVAPPDQSEEQA